MNKGITNQIIGPVIDIKFDPEKMPELLNAINIPFGEKNIVAEAAQHIGDDVVRCERFSLQTGSQRNGSPRYRRLP